MNVFGSSLKCIRSFAIGLISLFCSVQVGALAAGDMQRVVGFEIDRTEVSVGYYRGFVEATGYTTAAERAGGGLVYEAGWQKKLGWTWKAPFGTPAQDNEPAVHVTFDDASAYCEWADKRLPTDEEWSQAAYTEYRVSPQAPFQADTTYPYPTGSEPTGANCLRDCGDNPSIDYSDRLNRGIGHAPVGVTSAGVNGLYDMGANVWEWTENGSKTDKGPRGGSWWYGAYRMRSDDYATKPRDMAVVYIGFRCVRDVGVKQ